MRSISQRARRLEVMRVQAEFMRRRSFRMMPWADGCYRVWLTEDGREDVLVRITPQLHPDDAAYNASIKQRAQALRMTHVKAYLRGDRAHEPMDIVLD